MTKIYVDISLVIPCYDQDIHFLEELLNKIYRFDVVPQQIIVVASGVSNILEHIKDFKNKAMPELIFSQISKRINQAKARNIGAKFANSKLIMFHDVDDIPHHQKFSITDQVFLQDPTIDFLVHGYSVSSENWHKDLSVNIELDYYLEPHPTTMGISARQKMPIHNSHITIHKKIFDKYQLEFDESLKAHRIEDSLLTRALLEKGLVGCMVRAELVHYRPSSAR